MNTPAPRRGWRQLISGLHPRLRALLIFAALLATVLVPVVLGGRESFRATLDFPLGGYAAIVGLILVSWLARAIKLQLLLRQFEVYPRLAPILGISLATDFAFMATPAGVGGYAASVYYLRRTGISTTQATAITAADQGLDILFFILALPLAGSALLWTAPLGRPNTLTLLAGAAVLCLVAVAIAYRRHLLHVLLGHDQPVTESSSRWQRGQAAVRRFTSKLRADSQPLLAGGPVFFAATLLLTTLQQLPRYAVLWTVLWTLGHPVSFMLTFLLQTFVLQAASWTGIPSGGGAAELGLSATLAPWVGRQDLATVLLVWRIGTLYLGLIVGAIAILVLSRQRPAALDSNASESMPAQTIATPPGAPH